MHPHKAAFALAALFTFLGVLQAQQSGREASREEYLAKFPWGQANSTPSDAMLLRIIVESKGAKRGVEVGTNTGFGAINMGIGFERNGGHLTTIEINAPTAEAARQHVQKAGLEKFVTVIQGDALKVLPTLEGPFDFVYLDAR
jgi:predicted O-methyltransferase YrrM